MPWREIHNRWERLSSCYAAALLSLSSSSSLRQYRNSDAKGAKKTIPMRAESQQIAWCDANPMFWLTRTANLAIAPRSSGAPRQDRVRTWQHYLASWKDQIIPYVGRVSTDRSMEAALLDTTPLWVNKSYTSDLVARHWNQSDPARQPQGIPPRDKVINRADAVIRKPLRVTSQRQEAIISLQWLDRILT